MEFSPVGILFVLLELFRPVLAPLGLIVAADILLLAVIAARRHHLRFAPAMKAAAALGLLLGIGAGLYLPPWTGASLAQLNSAVDVLALCGAAIGFAVAAALLLYPLVQLLFRAPPVPSLPPRSASDHSGTGTTAAARIKA